MANFINIGKKESMDQPYLNKEGRKGGITNLNCAGEIRRREKKMEINTWFSISLANNDVCFEFLSILITEDMGKSSKAFRWTVIVWISHG